MTTTAKAIKELGRYEGPNFQGEMMTGIDITAIRLGTDGDDIIVQIEIAGRWIEVIRERKEGPISHIVEKSGISKAISEAT